MELQEPSKDINNYVVLDCESGTYFPAANTTLINWSTLTEEQKEIMIEGSDMQRCLLADEVGVPYILEERAE